MIEDINALFRHLYASGRIIDLILLGVVMEAALLVWYRQHRGRGPRLRDLFPTLLSGVLLLLALRAALTGSWWGWVAAPLALALPVHVFDLSRHWRASPVDAPER